MTLPKIKPIYLTIIIIVILIVVFAALYLASKNLPPTTSTNTETATTEKETRLTPNPSPVGYEIQKPILTSGALFWTKEEALEYYNLADKQATNPDFPTADSDFIVEEVIPLSEQNDKVVLLLQSLKDNGLQYAVFNLTTKQIETKFTDRLKAIAWQKDQQKLLGYALSATGDPFFLTTSLDAKDQKAIIKTADTNVTPLILTDKALVYLTDKTIKQIDLEKKQVSDVATDVLSLPAQAGAVASSDGEVAAYTTDKGLFAITKSDLQKISVSQSVPDFFNWSDNVLMIGKKSADGISISRWKSSNKQLVTLKTITFDDVVQSVEAAFEDKINNKLIYWSGGFLYETALQTPQN